MIPFIRTLIWAVVMSFALQAPFGHAQSAQGAKRAVLFGIKDYSVPAGQNGQGALASFQTLTTPCKDIEKVEARLIAMHWNDDEQSNGREVFSYCDPSVDVMASQLRALAHFLLENPHSLGFVYFAAHGAEINGKNYIFAPRSQIDLLSAKRWLQTDPQLPLFINTAIQIQSDFVRYMTANCQCDVVLVLDICRDDPFAYERIENGLGLKVRVSSPGSTNASAGSGFFFSPLRVADA